MWRIDLSVYNSVQCVQWMPFSISRFRFSFLVFLAALPHAIQSKENVECTHIIPSLITTLKDALSLLCCMPQSVATSEDRYWPSMPASTSTSRISTPTGPDRALPSFRVGLTVTRVDPDLQPLVQSLNPADLCCDPKQPPGLPAFDAEARQLLLLLNDERVQKQRPPSKAPAARENPFSCPKLVSTCPN